MELINKKQHLAVACASLAFAGAAAPSMPTTEERVGALAASLLPGTASAALARPTVTHPETGRTVQVPVLKAKAASKAQAKRHKPTKTQALRLVQRTGWGWAHRVVRCAAGGWGGYWASWVLPVWVRVGSVVAGCVVAA